MAFGDSANYLIIYRLSIPLIPPLSAERAGEARMRKSVSNSLLANI